MKTKLNKATKVKLNSIIADIKKRGMAPLSAKAAQALKNLPPLAVGHARHKAAEGKPVRVLAAGATNARIKAKKGSRLAAVYANILKGVSTWQVQGHPSPQYTTGNVPAHTVLTSGTAKVVKKGFTKPVAPAVPTVKGKKVSKLFTPPAKDVELGKQVKALRKATKPVA